MHYLIKRAMTWKAWTKAPTVIGTAVVLAGLYYTSQTLIATREQSRSTQDQVRLAEQGQQADRFGRAVEQLGSDKIDVRLGAIYAFEHLVRDAHRFQPAVVDVLAAFVRSHAPVDTGCNREQRTPPSDIHSAVVVIGRLDRRGDGPNFIDLSNTCLVGADLRGVDLRNAQLDHTSLRRASLADAKLSRANLANADLTIVHLDGVDVSHAVFYGADLSGTELRGLGNFAGALGLP